MEGIDQRELLRVEKINKYFPGVHAVKDVSLSINSNEVLGICGENGAGKSTLLKIFGGVYQPESGSIYYHGKAIHFRNPHESIKSGISIIHQELSYLDELTVAENIYQGLLPTKRFGIVDWKKMISKAEDVFKKYEIDINVRLKMKELPLASKQLVEIIKAVSRDAILVIMDEPSSSLGPLDVPKLMKITNRLVQDGRSVVFISHRLEELFEICDRIIVLCDGKMTAEFYKGNYKKMDVVSKMVGRKFTQLYPKDDVEKGNIRLKVENLCTSKLKNISLEVYSGEIVALYGMAGSGQDLILESIFGLSGEMTGDIFLDGKKLNIKSPKDAIEKGIAYIPAERKKDGLILNHSVEQNIVLACLKKIAPKGLIKYTSQKNISEKWIKNLNIKTPSSNALIGNLSGGNQQKTIIAKWLEINPKVFLLNDMTRGVDVAAKYDMYKIIQDLCKRGISVLLITSDMLELLSVADRLYTVWDNRITASFTREEMDQNTIMYAAINKAKEVEKV